MTNHRPAVPYRRHYVLWRRVKISFFFFFFSFQKASLLLLLLLLHSNRAAPAEPITFRRSSFGPCGWHFKEAVVTVEGERDNGERALRRGLWQMERGCSEEWELLGYLEVSLKKSVDVILPPTQTSAICCFCLAFLHFSSRMQHSEPTHREESEKKRKKYTSCCRDFRLKPADKEIIKEIKRSQSLVGSWAKEATEELTNI